MGGKINFLLPVAIRYRISLPMSLRGDVAEVSVGTAAKSCWPRNKFLESPRAGPVRFVSCRVRFLGASFFV